MYCCVRPRKGGVIVPTPTNAWMFDNPLSTVYDAEIGSSNINLGSTATQLLVPNKFGTPNKALQIANSNHGSITQALYNGTGPCSMFCRLKPTSTTATQYILSRRDSNNAGQIVFYIVYTGSDFQLRMYMGNTASTSVASSDVTFPLNQWADLCVTRNGNTVTLSVNKVHKTMNITSYSVNASPWYFGYDRRDNSAFLSGQISEMYFWNGTVLSADQIDWLTDTENNFNL